MNPVAMPALPAGIVEVLEDGHFGPFLESAALVPVALRVSTTLH
jgi:hypothetical protein